MVRVFSGEKTRWQSKMTMYTKVPSKKNHRQTPCDLCKNNILDIKKEVIPLMNGQKDIIYAENCAVCGNLLYGIVTRGNK